MEVLIFQITLHMLQDQLEILKIHHMLETQNHILLQLDYIMIAMNY